MLIPILSRHPIVCTQAHRFVALSVLFLCRASDAIGSLVVTHHHHRIIQSACMQRRMHASTIMAKKPKERDRFILKKKPAPRNANAQTQLPALHIVIGYRLQFAALDLVAGIRNVIALHMRPRHFASHEAVESSSRKHGRHLQGSRTGVQ